MRSLKIILISSAVLLFSACSSNIKVISYNVGVFNKSGENSSEMIARMLSQKKADFVGLCELDSCTVRTGGDFQLDSLKSQMKGDYQMIFAPALNFQGGKYGIGMLINGKYPILESHVLPLYKKDGAENRVCCIARTKEVFFAVTHLDHISHTDRLEQCRQITSELSKLAKESGKPVILCGDFNSAAQSKELEYLKNFWIQVSPSQATFPSDNPRECIDYIFVLKGSKLSAIKSHVIKSGPADFDATSASDHLPVYAEFRLSK